MNKSSLRSVTRRDVARALSLAIGRCLAPFRSAQFFGQTHESELSHLVTPPASAEPIGRTSDVGMVVDVRARGARGDGRTDDGPAIATAIEEVRNAGGGTVFFPNGRYVVAKTLVLPSGSRRHVRLRGDTRRTSVLIAAQRDQTVVRVGAESPSRSGTAGEVTYYGSIEDLTISGGDTGSGRGLHLVQSALLTVQRVNIEGFRAAGGSGLVVEGSTTMTGLGGLATPHALDNRFYDLLIVDCQRPLVLQNADENLFVALRIGVTTGLRDAPKRFGVEIRQGLNNRFFGCTIQGDVRNSESYIGVGFRAPINTMSEAGGDVKGNNFHGLVVEGFDTGVWFESSPNTAGNVCHDANFSICRIAYRDDGRQNGYGNGIIAPLHDINYLSGRSAYSDALTIEPNSVPNAVVTPSVRGGNVFACANRAPTRIAMFGDGANGQIIVVRLDGRTTIQNGPNLHLASRRDFLGAADDTLTLANFGGSSWFELARSANH